MLSEVQDWDGIHSGQNAGPYPQKSPGSILWAGKPLIRCDAMDAMDLMAVPEMTIPVPKMTTAVRLAEEVDAHRFFPWRTFMAGK